jgi:hypothetical protein
MKTYKYMDFYLLKKLNNKAKRLKKNKSISDMVMDSLDKTKVYPIILNILHNDFEQRCQILFNQDGARGFLDMDCEDFQTLPRGKA